MSQKQFKLLKISSDRMGEHQDCAVKAVAIVAGLTYMDAHKIMKTHGRKNRETTPDRITRKALRQLGFKLKKIKFRAKTIRTIERELDPNKIYLVWVRRHVLAVRGGEVCDWSRGRLHRVKEVREVLK